MTSPTAQQVFGLTLSWPSSPSWPISWLSREMCSKDMGSGTRKQQASMRTVNLWSPYESYKNQVPCIFNFLWKLKHERNCSPMAVFSASHRSPMPASLHFTSPGFGTDTTPRSSHGRSSPQQHFPVYTVLATLASSFLTSLALISKYKPIVLWKWVVQTACCFELSEILKKLYTLKHLGLTHFYTSVAGIRRCPIFSCQVLMPRQRRRR